MRANSYLQLVRDASLRAVNEMPGLGDIKHSARKVAIHEKVDLVCYLFLPLFLLFGLVQGNTKGLQVKYLIQHVPYIVAANNEQPAEPRPAMHAGIAKWGTGE